MRGHFLYVNGNLESSQTGITYQASGVNNFVFLGPACGDCTDNAGSFAGNIAMVQIYGQKALTVEEIQENYLTYASRFALRDGRFRVNQILTRSGSGLAIQLPSMGSTTRVSIVSELDDEIESRSYLIDVRRSSNDAALESLEIRALSSGTIVNLSPSFHPDSSQSRFGTVISTVSMISVSPVCRTGRCVMFIGLQNIAENTANVIALGQEGSTSTFTLTSTSEDGSSTRSYTFSIRRMWGISRISHLFVYEHPSGLAISLSPAFSPTQGEMMNAAIHPIVSSVLFLFYCERNPCSVQLNGVIVSPGVQHTRSLETFGEVTSFTLASTSEDGQSQSTYQFQFKRLVPPPLSFVPLLYHFSSSPFIPASLDIAEISLHDPDKLVRLN